MEKFAIRPIGYFRVSQQKNAIVVEKRYVKGLQGLAGFSHLVITWWLSELATSEARSVITVPQPYKGAPAVMGVFATRSPVRPNPLAITIVEITDIDMKTGIIQIPYTDAFDYTPVLDIKPYTPSVDCVEKAKVPNWCQHWPKSLEDAMNFDWQSEFNF